MRKNYFLTINSPLHDLIISPHVKHLKKLPKKVFSAMQSFFMKKFPHTSQGRRRNTMLYLQIFSHF